MKANVLNSTAAQLSWQPPLEEEQNGIIAFYSLILLRNTSNILGRQNFTFASTLVDLTSLRPFSEYTVSIAASTAIGMGPFTAPQVFRTPEDGE